jgi:predicted lipoprotein with Yx(FWY)xxD motif
MKKLSILLTSGVLALVGCGDDDESSSPAPAAPTAEQTTTKERDDKPAAKGTAITVGESEFGDMLFDENKQAIYIFENDPKGETVCYDECAEAWPPVLTKGEPAAAEGVDEALLGTVERRDGTKQVTYNEQPLYFYANEAPGEVRCHNVDLNGGLWWVVGPDGERRP